MKKSIALAVWSLLAILAAQLPAQARQTLDATQRRAISKRHGRVQPPRLHGGRSVVAAAGRARRFPRASYSLLPAHPWPRRAAKLPGSGELVPALGRARQRARAIHAWAVVQLRPRRSGKLRASLHVAEFGGGPCLGTETGILLPDQGFGRLENVAGADRQGASAGGRVSASAGAARFGCDDRAMRRKNRNETGGGGGGKALTSLVFLRKKRGRRVGPPRSLYYFLFHSVKDAGPAVLLRSLASHG